MTGFRNLGDKLIFNIFGKILSMKNLPLIFSMFLILSCAAPVNVPQRQSTPVVNTAPVPKTAEKTEYEQLMERDEADKQTRTAKVLNYLMNSESPADPNTAVVVDNFTNCNIIVRIVGKKTYNLPVPKGGKNFLIVEKGNYTLRSELCKSTYYSQKVIKETLLLKLSERTN